MSIVLNRISSFHPIFKCFGVAIKSQDTAKSHEEPEEVGNALNTSSFFCYYCIFALHFNGGFFRDSRGNVINYVIPSYLI